jgi:hypothetical protein
VSQAAGAARRAWRRAWMPDSLPFRAPR